MLSFHCRLTIQNASVYKDVLRVHMVNQRDPCALYRVRLSGTSRGAMEFYCVLQMLGGIL